MKFHRLHLQNLNSLYGKHDLDFDKQIGAAPVFLIVGPTGSGKSTILDAISLALFGETPRLDRRTGKPERDVAHIMSLGTAVSLVVLDFSMRENDGSRSFYRATWSMRRARQDPEGKIQRPERSLHRLTNGVPTLLISDNRAKFYEPIFSEVMRGIGVEDFKRSVILAQGEFAAFLNAEDAEKASILERVTNTEQYRVIGSRAASRRREWEQKYRLKRERIGEAADFAPVDHETLRAQQIARTNDVAEVEKRVAKSRVELQWVEKADRLGRELEQQELALQDVGDRLKEAEPDFKRLETDRLVRPAAEAILSLRKLEEELAKTVQEQVSASESLASATKRAGDAEQTLEAAKAHVVAVRKQAEELAPGLQEAERILARVAATSESLEVAKRDLSRAIHQYDQIQRRHMALVERRSSLVAEAARVGKMLEEGEARGGFEALETLFREALRPAFVERERRQRRVGELEGELATIDARYRVFEEVEAVSAKKRSPLVGQVTRRLRMLTELAGDRPEARRAEIFNGVQASGQRRDALIEAGRLGMVIAGLEGDRSALHESLTRIRKEIQDVEAEERRAKSEELFLRAKVKDIEEQTTRARQRTVLSELRSELVTGVPCALCGSPLHPFCSSDELKILDDSAANDAQDLQLALLKARGELQESNFEVQQLAAKYVSRTTSLRHEEGREVAIAGAIEKALRDFSMAAEASGFSPLDSYRLRNPDILDAELRNASDSFVERESELKKLDVLITQFKNAERTLAEYDQENKGGREALEAVSKERASLSERFEAARAEAESSTQTLNSRMNDFRTSLGVWGIEVEPDVLLKDPELYLEKAREGSVELGRLEQHHRELSETLVGLEASAAGLAEQSEASRADKIRHTITVADLEAARVAEGAELRSLLGERTLAEIRREQSRSLEEAQNRVDRAAEFADSGRKELVQLQAAAGEREKRQTRLQTEQGDWESTLSKIVAQLGVEEEFVRSMVLEESVRERIERTQGALRERLAVLTERRSSIRTEIVDHHKAEPVTPLSLANASAAVEEAESALSVSTQALGAASEALERAAGAQQRQADLQSEMLEIEAELEKWSTVAGLIGVGDGTSFKLFAQTLNLRGLVERANHRLENLHPRYRLDVPEAAERPSLSFLIRDRYRANAARPLSTMSGGETFLVSLALALALSDYRRIEFPVETLLLDEGFGTLDQDSLQMALNTLHRLHQDGSRQIGIISHVDSLRDMVDTRILVEGAGHGRSVLRVERGAPPRENSR